ncbi:dTDP-glucose 4,6-dehydratase [Coralliovum pocilloporae]|uniref:dTDP-glucose 4,6-dehydratase n=1 Tax=Coralliovum pocilloporae TaxID=3066369 RepID=UPI003306E0F8
MRFLITGGAGFIGSAVCRRLASNPAYRVVNLDKLTYAGNLSSLRSLDNCDTYRFVQGDITDRSLVEELLFEEEIDVLMHLAAESHVDRSIEGPADFIETNIVGTFQLLQAARTYYDTLTGERRERFRFHHVSTDEVFGDLPYDDSLFREDSPYAPSSPYSASKASSDHLVRAWHETYKLPVVLSNCSNNFGPFQYPEKFIPVIILNALDGQSIPVYGNGENVRDWLFVDDHAKALEMVARDGRLGESYNIGGDGERRNLDVVHAICTCLDKVRPREDGTSYTDQIRFVTDRPGHDRRYAIDASKIKSELGWQAEQTFETGLQETINWYLENPWWWSPLRG